MSGKNETSGKNAAKSTKESFRLFKELPVPDGKGGIAQDENGNDKKLLSHVGFVTTYFDKDGEWTSTRIQNIESGVSVNYVYFPKDRD